MCNLIPKIFLTYQRIYVLVESNASIDLAKMCNVTKLKIANRIIKLQKKNWQKKIEKLKRKQIKYFIVSVIDLKRWSILIYQMDKKRFIFTPTDLLHKDRRI